MKRDFDFVQAYKEKVKSDVELDMLMLRSETQEREIEQKEKNQ